MKTFVISLRRAEARRKFIQQQFDAIRLPFEFFDAFDGRLMSKEFIEQNADTEIVNKWPGFLNPGAIGCALSHYSIYKRMVDENIDVALILEDDIQVDGSLKSILHNLENTISQEEIVMLYFQSNQQVAISSKKTIPLDNDHELQYLVEYGYVGSAGAYVLTRAVAQRMIQFLHPIHTVADDWCMFKQQGAFSHFRCVIPFPAYPVGFKSTIDYLEKDSFIGRVSSIVDKYNIFPFKQILSARRKSTLRRMQAYTIVDQDPFLNSDVLSVA